MGVLISSVDFVVTRAISARGKKMQTTKPITRVRVMPSPRVVIMIRVVMLSRRVVCRSFSACRSMLCCSMGMGVYSMGMKVRKNHPPVMMVRMVCCGDRGDYGGNMVGQIWCI